MNGDLLLVIKSSTYLKGWSALVPLLGFLTTDWLSGNAGFGVVIAAFLSVMVALVNNRPKLIAARAAANIGTAAAHDQHMNAVVTQLSQIHERDIAFWKEKVTRQEKVEVLIRATKHRLVAAYQGAAWWIRDLEDLLRENKIAFEPYKDEAFNEITGDEDEAMVEMVVKGTKL